jgi:hypothetical protein
LLHTPVAETIRDREVTTMRKLGVIVLMGDVVIGGRVTMMKRGMAASMLLVLSACKPSSSTDGANGSAPTATATATTATATAAAAPPVVPVAVPQADQPSPTAGTGPCSSIQLGPAQAGLFSIESASYDGRRCQLVVQAKRPIPQQVAFDWIDYDKDGVKLGNHVEILKGLDTGDKQKLSLRPEDGTAKITTKSR